MKSEKIPFFVYNLLKIFLKFIYISLKNYTWKFFVSRFDNSFIAIYFLLLYKNMKKTNLIIKNIT